MLSMGKTLEYQEASCKPNTSLKPELQGCVESSQTKRHTGLPDPTSNTVIPKIPI